MRDIKYYDAGPNEYRYKRESVWVSAVYLVVILVSILLSGFVPWKAYLFAIVLGPLVIIVGSLMRTTIKSEEVIKGIPFSFLVHGLLWPISTPMALLNVLGNRRYFKAPKQENT